MTDDERRCVHCSLSPVCLPEEGRAALDPDRPPTRLFPKDDDRRAVHVLGHGSRVGRAAQELVITPREGEVSRVPIHETRSVTVHGYAQISAQALHLCADQGVGVHWITGSGRYAGSFWGADGGVQRRLRQHEALREPGFRLSLARRLVEAKVESQLRFLRRATRGSPHSEAIETASDRIRGALAQLPRAEAPETLLGLEGLGAAAYFGVLHELVADGVDPAMRPDGRSRRPPRDPFNALLSFGYGLLMREVVQALRAVGLDGAIGLYHQPRSAAPPLALDLMELFRVSCVDVPVMAAVNRRTFEPNEDFTRGGAQVWCSDTGRKKLITVIERRLDEETQHPVLQYSLSFRRHIELEARLLEKEWCGEPGLFARQRSR